MLEHVGADLSHFPPDMKMIPTVYRSNFRDPLGVLSSTLKACRMRNRDSIYVANA